ncbi:MAG TPA: hypothetical protein VGL30_09885 [Phenylobacterium sp.]
MSGDGLEREGAPADPGAGVLAHIRRQLLAHERLQVHPHPADLCKKAVRPCKRLDAPADGLLVRLDVIALGEPDDRLHHRQQIVGAMVHFVGQQPLLFFRRLAVGDVHQHVHRADQPARVVEQRRGIGQEGHAGAVRPLRNRFHATHRPSFPQGDGHRAFAMRQWNAVDIVKPPGYAPELAHRRAAAGEGRRGLVVAALGGFELNDLGLVELNVSEARRGIRFVRHVRPVRER